MSRPVAATGVYVDICGGPASNAMNAGMTVFNDSASPCACIASIEENSAKNEYLLSSPRYEYDLHSFELGGRGDLSGQHRIHLVTFAVGTTERGHHRKLGHVKPL